MRLAHPALLATLALSVTPCAGADDTSTLTLGTATPGGGFAAYGEALAETIRGIDPGLVLELRATEGSGENVPLLEAGQLDLALVEGTVAFEALSGVGRAPAKLPVVFAMYSSPGMFVVRGDSPHRTIADLKGSRVVFGAKSSGLVVLARYVLDGLGLDMRMDFDAVLLDSARDGPPMVIEGKAAALWGGGIGWPGFLAVARGRQRAHFIGLEMDDIARIRKKHPFLKTLTVPAGSYPGQDHAISTVGAWSLILARPDLPEQTAWRFARALEQGQLAFGMRLAQARESTAANTVTAVPDPQMLHPGVARYFREIGLMP